MRRYFKNYQQDYNTNILKLVTTFNEDEAVGPITEMAIFGGNASAWENGAGKDTGYMFNR